MVYVGSSGCFGGTIVRGQSIYFIHIFLELLIVPNMGMVIVP